MTESQALWWMIIAAILATYIWRFLGTIFARTINPDGAAFQWVVCVSYAMLAGLIARMVFIPVGALIEVPLWIRISGIAVGLAVFFLVKKEVLLAVAAGLAVFIALL